MNIDLHAIAGLFRAEEIAVIALVAFLGGVTWGALFYFSLENRNPFKK